MALVFKVKVIPVAGRVRWRIDKAGMLKVDLKNPPEQGKANRELIQLIAKAVRVPLASVAIIVGEAARTKSIRIEAPIVYDQLIALLGIERQLLIENMVFK